MPHVFTRRGCPSVIRHYNNDVYITVMTVPFTQKFFIVVTKQWPVGPNELRTKLISRRIHLMSIIFFSMRFYRIFIFFLPRNDDYDDENNNHDGDNASSLINAQAIVCRSSEASLLRFVILFRCQLCYLLYIQQ